VSAQFFYETISCRSSIRLHLAQSIALYNLKEKGKEISINYVGTHIENTLKPMKAKTMKLLKVSS
jgi:hypothetical protein